MRSYFLGIMTGMAFTVGLMIYGNLSRAEAQSIKADEIRWMNAGGLGTDGLPHMIRVDEYGYPICSPMSIKMWGWGQ